MTLCQILLVVATVVLLSTSACPPDQGQNGCKIVGRNCLCGYGCRTEYVYKTRRSCLQAIRAPPVITTPLPTVRTSNSNTCFHLPCSRGTCIQTTDDKGFTCKCDGTGFYGQRCEKACPTIPVRGMAFPYECIVI